MALCDIYLTPSKWRRGEISWLSGEEKERADDLISPLWDAREKLWLDERYIYCHVMAVHPKYQRKGIGQLLMEYVIGIAQQTELPIYIESSEEGTRLYEKMGCRRVKQPSKNESADPATRDKDAVGEANGLVLFVWIPKGGEEKLPKSIELI
jgi:GNAT superfamily N-acetyltransferase